MNNDLHEYLTKYFKGSIGEFEGQSVDIIPHFFDRFGVIVKIENDRYMFKYDMLACSFTRPITKYCRGAIFQYKNSNWNCICASMDKFHNHDESFSPIFTEQEFQNYFNQIELKTKEDGSLLHIYMYNGEWTVSTSGAIIPHFANDSGIKFDELFWMTAKLDKKTFLSKLDPDCTHIFELCSKLNKVVSDYAFDRIYLLNIRNNKTGMYLPINDLANELQVLIPKSIFLYELPVKTKEELTGWVESVCKDDEDCKIKEGYVGYINNKPSFKMKSQKYKFHHAFKGQNNNETRNHIVSAYFNNLLDDVYGSLHDHNKLFVESLRLKVLNCMTEVSNCVDGMKRKTFTNQKEYALYVLENGPKQFSAFFFQNKEKIINQDSNIKEYFSDWLRTNYQKYDSYWKS